MILSEEQTLSLLDGQTEYNCFLLKQRIGYPFFKQQSSPIGNLISFQAPVRLGELFMQRGIVFCGELLNTTMFAGACFHRLLLSQIGSLLSQELQKDCFVNENVLIIDDRQASISVLNRYKDNVLFHIILPEVDKSEKLYNIELKFDNAQKLKGNVIGSFQYLLNSLYLETQHDNF